jgi:hypothetical protein
MRRLWQEEVSMGGVSFKNMRKKLKFNGGRLSSPTPLKIRIFPSKYFYISFGDQSCKLTSDWWLLLIWIQCLVVLSVGSQNFGFSFGFIGELIEFYWVMFWNIKSRIVRVIETLTTRSKLIWAHDWSWTEIELWACVQGLCNILFFQVFICDGNLIEFLFPTGSCALLWIDKCPGSLLSQNVSTLIWLVIYFARMTYCNPIRIALKYPQVVVVRFSDSLQYINEQNTKVELLVLLVDCEKLWTRLEKSWYSRASQQTRSTLSAADQEIGYVQSCDWRSE